MWLGPRSISFIYTKQKRQLDTIKIKIWDKPVDGVTSPGDRLFETAIQRPMRAGFHFPAILTLSYGIYLSHDNVVDDGVVSSTS